MCRVWPRQSYLGRLLNSIVRNLMSIRPVLFDYIRFFGSKPIETHDDGWYYGIRFAITRADDDLLVTIAPDNMEFVLEWKQKGQRRLSLNLKMVSGWQIEKNGADEFLLLHINTGPEAMCSFDHCIIRLKPTIDVELLMNWDSGWLPGTTSALHTDALKSDLPVN